MNLTSEFTLTVILIIIGFLFITSIVKRKYKTTQYPIYLLLLSSFGLWVNYSITDLDVTFKINPRLLEFSFIPFNNIFKDICVDGKIIQYLDNYIFILLFFSIIWGICIPFLINKPNLKKVLKTTTYILLPLNTLFGVLYILGITSRINFDLFSYIFIYLFSFIGYKIYEVILKKEIKTND